MTTKEDITLRFVPTLGTYINASLETCTQMHVTSTVILHVQSSAFAEAILKHFILFQWSKLFISPLPLLFYNESHIYIHCRSLATIQMTQDFKAPVCCALPHSRQKEKNHRLFFL